MRICLVTPRHLSANPRLVKEAFALRSAGHDVHIVCGCYDPSAVRSDRKIETNLGHVTKVAFGPFMAPRATYLRQTLLRHGARAVARRWGGGINLLETAHDPVAQDLADATRTIKADLYVAHYVAALPAAARAARQHGRRFAFDAEDFHLGDLPNEPGHALEKKIIRAIEGHYLPHAAFVTAASPMIAEAYAEAYDIPTPTVILNIVPKANAPASPTPLGTAAPGPSLYWFSQTIGPGRGIETAIDALAQARTKPHLYLRGKPAAGYQAELFSRARRLEVADRLHFLPPAPPDDLERLGAEYDLGYSGETGFSPNNVLALGNKLFSYLSSGLPIVASNIPSHQRLAPELGEVMILFPVRNAIALAHAIDEFLLHPNRLAASRAQAWSLGQSQYSWKSEQASLLNLFEKAMK